MKKEHKKIKKIILDSKNIITEINYTNTYDKEKIDITEEEIGKFVD